MTQILGTVFPGIIALCFLMSPVGLAQALDAKNLARSIVILQSVEGIRSGVVVAPQTVISTCSLKYQPADIIVYHAGHSLSAELQFADRRRDLCQYQVADLDAPAVRLGSAKQLKVKNKISVAGVAAGKEVSAQTGVVTALRPFEESNYLQISNNLVPSLSGGGVFNAAGELVGIAHFYMEEANLNFALPVEWLREIPDRAMGDQKYVFTEGLPSRLKWLNKAILLEKKSDWRGLEKHSLRWTKQDAKDRWGWLSLASAYVNLSQYRKAATAYEAALRLSPNYAVAWNNLGTAYQKIGAHHKALSAYQMAAKLDPQSASAWFNLGTAFQQQQIHRNAVNAYLEAGGLAPEQASVWYNLGISYAELGQIPEAINAYRQTLKLKPQHVNARHNLSLIEKQSVEFSPE